MPQRIDPEIRTRGTVRNGKFISLSPFLRQKYLASKEGQQIEEIFREVIEEVTPDQMGYFHGGIIRFTCMQSEMFAGWTEESIKAYFKTKYLWIPRMEKLNGKYVEFKEYLRLRDCGVKKMSEFIEQVLHELAENGIEVPAPENFILNKYSTKVR